MPSRIDRAPRRRTRLLALVLTSAALSAGTAALPSSASAYQEHFCQYAYMWSGQNCFSYSAHTLQAVDGWTINSYQRICAASFTSPWGAQTSDWRCDYGFTEKWLGGRVSGVGGLHNGDPYPFWGYGVQEF